jgi:DNA-directed RNA polymerase alpha subunit
MEIEKLDLDVRTYNAVKRAGVNTIEDLQEKIVNDPDDLRRNTGYATFAKLK